jgi:DNA-binding transcriptional MerR regulator
MKSTFKLAEICKQLDLPPYVLRYWETEFPALQAPGKGSGPARPYTAEEVAVIRRIKQLLYEEGYTIAGARKKLEGEPAPVPGAVATAAVAGDEARRLAVPATADDEPEGDVAPASELDSRPDERIETLRRGVAEALREARAILSILEKSNR